MAELTKTGRIWDSTHRCELNRMGLAAEHRDRISHHPAGDAPLAVRDCQSAEGRLRTPPESTFTLFELRSGRRAPCRSKARTEPLPKSPHPYLLRGVLHCGLCDRRMQGSARSGGRILYRADAGRLALSRRVARTRRPSTSAKTQSSGGWTAGWRYWRRRRRWLTLLPRIPM